MKLSTTSRRIVVASLASASVLVGLAAVAGPSFADTPVGHGAQPQGWVPVVQCATMTGNVEITPGLLRKARNETVVLSATISNCSIDTEPVSGQGTLTLDVSGMASAKTGNLTGTFSANWPAGADLNPSAGNVTLATTQKGVYSISGTITGGAFTGEPLQGGYVVTGKTGSGKKANPITAETFVNTTDLEVLENLG